MRTTVQVLGLLAAAGFTAAGCAGNTEVVRTTETRTVRTEVEPAARIVTRTTEHHDGPVAMPGTVRIIHDPYGLHDHDEIVRTRTTTTVETD
jgi:hypothetical protein